MTLTPADIEQKTFSTALRGYNLDEVDDFLDEIVRTMRKLHEDLDEARAAKPAPVAAPVEAPPTPAPTPIPTPPPAPVIDESALGKALIAAQETAERIVNDAREEAQQIVSNAQTEADTYEETRARHRKDAEGELSRLDLLVERVKSELAELSAAVGVDLSAMSGTLEGAITEIDAEAAAAAAEAEAESETGTEETIVESDSPTLYDQDEYEFEEKAETGEPDEDEKPATPAVGAVTTDLEDAVEDDEEEGDEVADDEEEDDEDEDLEDEDDSDDADDAAADDYFNYPEAEDDEEPTRP
jgi:cell division initiation protein